MGDRLLEYLVFDLLQHRLDSVPGPDIVRGLWSFVHHHYYNRVRDRNCRHRQNCWQWPRRPFSVVQCHY